MTYSSSDSHTVDPTGAPATGVRSPSADHLIAIAESLRQSSFPHQLGIEVTGYCNLRCAMCHHPTLQRPKGRMPMELFRKCVDEVAAVSPDTEVWCSFNGEPLLAPALLLDMIVYAKSVGLTSMNLNTNGMLLTEDIADRLLDSSLDLVVFGIDGLSRETYERIRRGGDRDRVYANVERMLEQRQRRAGGPTIMVQFIEMDENASERAAFVKYWHERGAIVKLRRKLSWGGRVDSALCLPAGFRIACPWAINLMHVFWDGTVPRCCADTEGTEAVGNAREESLFALWERLSPYREMHLAGEFRRLPARCATCRDWMVGASEKLRPDSGPFAAS